MKIYKIIQLPIKEPIIKETRTFFYIGHSYFVLLSGELDKENTTKLELLDFENDSTIRNNIRKAMEFSFNIDDLQEDEKQAYDICCVPSYKSLSDSALWSIKELSQSYQDKYNYVDFDDYINYSERFTISAFIVEAVNNKQEPNKDFIAMLSKEAKAKGITEVDLAKSIITQAKNTNTIKQAMDDFVTTKTNEINKVATTKVSELEKAKSVQTIITKALNEAETEFDTLIKTV